MKMNLNLQKMLLASALAFATASHAAYISEYFNGYGTTTQNLELVATGGGTGWGGNWSRPGGGTAGSYTDYVAGTAVNPTVTGYQNTGNNSGASDGTAGNAAFGSNMSYNSHRATDALTGDIWMSVAYQLNTQFGNGRVSLNLDNTAFSGPSNGAYMQVGNASNDPQGFYYGGALTTTPASTWNFNQGTAYLLMVRITLDYDVNGNDRMQFWTHPGDVSSIAALGTPDFLGEGSDVFGASIGHFGLTVGQDSRLDSIRISNESDGFEFVTTGTAIPEPGTLALLGIALGTLVFFRRRHR